jgi:hypothetical protein
VRARPVPLALGAWLLLALLAAGLAACSGGGSGEGDVSITFRLEPRPPRVGTADLELRLIDPAGDPVPGASVAVEANMNHAGMQPTFATLEERGGGLYAGTIEFTMGGDWFLLVTAELEDGRQIERRLDVPGVATP